MSGTSMKKKFNGIADKDHADRTLSPKAPTKSANGKGENAGQMRGNAQMDKFADPLNRVSAEIGGMNSLTNDIGESSGFVTDGYLDKQDTPYGEAAKFNFLPPGMEISNQENAEIHRMPLKTIVDPRGYEGDSPWPLRDIPE